MNRKIKAGINTTLGMWHFVFKKETREKLKTILDFDERQIAREISHSTVLKSVRNAEVVLSTWNAVPYTKEILAECPNLKIIIYAAGSVKNFLTDDLIERKVKVCSAAHLNAIPVAEFTLGLILTSLKNVFVYHTDFLKHGSAAWKRDAINFNGGYYKTKIGLVGFGEISKYLLNLLQNFDFQLFISSSHITKEQQRKYKVKAVTLDYIMKNCDVVSLHMAEIPRNFNIINKDNLKLMKHGARLINTSRGKLINEDDLVDKLKENTITAYIDVTYPEPPRKDHPIYSLPNCILTPHIAGSIGTEVHRMGEYAYRELQNWIKKAPLENEVDVASISERA